MPSFDGYSEEEWRRIKDVVGMLGLDADAARVGHSRTLLFDALEGLAARYQLDYYIDQWKLPPKRAVKELGDTLAEIKKVQRRLNILGRVGSYAPAQAIVASKALSEFVSASALRPRLDAAREAGSGSRFNAGKPQRRSYLIALHKIWSELVRQSQRKLKSERKLQAAFLLACAAPGFAADAAVIKHFLDSQRQ